MSAGFIYNGIHCVSWWHDEYLRDSTDSISALVDTGANWVGLLVTWYQTDAHATDIAPDQHKTPTDAALTHAINQFHDRNLKVMLKPHVDGADGSWRGQFDPNDREAWFRSYKTFILRYARMAAALEVEGLIMGTEFVLLSGVANQVYWEDLIASIREVYSGVLTYAANAAFPQDEFTSVSFWSMLDLIGLDGYFPLTQKRNPSLAQLIAAWNRNRNGDNVVQLIQEFQQIHKKPIIFTELGYRSVAGANREPWNAHLHGVSHPAEQAHCYAAFLYVWTQYSDWMQGVFWWNWPIAAADAGGYTPRNKPASEVVLSRAWKKRACANPLASEAPPERDSATMSACSRPRQKIQLTTNVPSENVRNAWKNSGGECSPALTRSTLMRSPGLSFGST